MPTKNDDLRRISQALQNLQSIVDVLSWIASRFDKAVDAVESFASIDDVIRELSNYLTGELDQIYKILLVILDQLDTETPNVAGKKMTDELRAEIVDGRVRSLKNQLKQHQQNVNQLEEQSAIYGASTPLGITNQIIRQKRKVAEIEAELAYFAK